MPDDLVITERAAIIGWRLHQGETLTTRQVADLLGIQPSGASKLMLKLCRVLPIVQIDGYWQIYAAAGCKLPAASQQQLPAASSQQPAANSQQPAGPTGLPSQQP